MAGGRARNVMLEGLERLRAVMPDANLTHVLVYLYICENEGINIAEVAEVCRLTRATASRTVQGLARRVRREVTASDEGLLVVRANPVWANGRLCFLSDAGGRLRQDLDRAIAKATPIKSIPTGPARKMPEAFRRSL